MTTLKTNKVAGLNGTNAIDGSVFFNGNYDSLGIPSIALGSGDWTIEFWFYMTKTSSTSQHLYDGRGTGSASGAYPIIQILTSEAISYYTAGATRITGSTTIQVGSWNHVALVKNSGTTTLYLNGVSEGTYSDSTTYIAPSNGIGRIGSDDDGNELYFYGYLSNYRICTHAVYTSNFFTPPTQKLELHNETVLLCCQDSDDPTQEATGKTITAYGNLDYSLRDYNLITNGNFDSSATDGWTVASGSAALGTGQSGTFGDGNHLVMSGGNIYQAFTTVVGRTYFVNCQSNGSDTSRISTSTSTGDAIITDIRSSPQTGSGVRGQKSFVATQTTYYVILSGGGDGNFDTVSVYEAESPKAPKVLPPVGIDAGTVLDGGVGYDSLNYLTLPKGTTTQSNRGRGLFGGGYYEPGAGAANLSSIEYFNIQSTGNSINFGDRTIVGHGLATLSSSTRGVMMGGRAYHYPSAPTANQTNIIDYVTIATTANAQDFGDMVDGSSYIFAAASNATRGIISKGGSTDMSYVTIASLGNSVDTGGDSTIARNTFTGFASPTRAIFAGGGTPSAINNIDYVTIASLGDAVNFGDLTFTGACQGASSETRGIIFTGGFPSAASNVIDFITIASAGNATDFGDLPANITSHSAGSGVSNSIRAVRCAGYVAPAATNRIDYVTIATTGNASDFGDMIQKRFSASGFSDSHGGLSE